jgi:hypothetical protein
LEVGWAWSEAKFEIRSTKFDCSKRLSGHCSRPHVRFLSSFSDLCFGSVSDLGFRNSDFKGEALAQLSEFMACRWSMQTVVEIVVRGLMPAAK